MSCLREIIMHDSNCFRYSLHSSFDTKFQYEKYVIEGDCIWLLVFYELRELLYPQHTQPQENIKDKWVDQLYKY